LLLEGIFDAHSKGLSVRGGNNDFEHPAALQQTAANVFALEPRATPTGSHGRWARRLQRLVLDGSACSEDLIEELDSLRCDGSVCSLPLHARFLAAQVLTLPASRGGALSEKRIVADSIKDRQPRARNEFRDPLPIRRGRCRAITGADNDANRHLYRA